MNLVLEGIPRGTAQLERELNTINIMKLKPFLTFISMSLILSGCQTLSPEVATQQPIDPVLLGRFRDNPDYRHAIALLGYTDPKLKV